MSLHVWLVTHNVVRGDGQGRVNYEIVRHLLEHGHRVSVVADRVEADLASSARVIHVSKGRFPTNLAEGQVFAQGAARALRRRVGPTDLVHANGFVTWTPCDVNTAHFVHAAWLASPQHTFRRRRGPRAFYHLAYTRANVGLERYAFSRARVVVAVSDTVRDQLVGAVGLPPSMVRVIPNGVDVQDFRPGVAPRASLGLPLDRRLVLFVGDLRTGVKNLDAVLRALRDVPGAELVVAGDLRASPYVKLADRLGLRARVHFLGFRRDVAELMRAVDVFVAPSHYEPFGLVILEAMACGLPVVTSAACGAAELMRDGTTGFVLQDENDTAALARALSRLVTQPEEAARMGAAARRVAEQHTWTAMAGRYLRLYEEIAGERPGRSAGSARAVPAPSPQRARAASP